MTKKEYQKEEKRIYNHNYWKKWIVKNRNKRRLYFKKYIRKYIRSVKRREWERKYEKSEKYKKRRRQYAKKHRLGLNMASSISTSLKDKKAGRKWETLVGYDIEKLKQRLENQFDENMNWNNYGSYWWIDHKKPRSLFKYETAEDQAFKDCWCLANLQPMEKIENISKGSKFLKS